MSKIFLSKAQNVFCIKLLVEFNTETSYQNIKPEQIGDDLN